MQSDDNPASRLGNPEGTTTIQHVAAAQRGVATLQVAVAVEFVAGLLNSVTRAYWMAGSGSLSEKAAMLGILGTVWQIVFLATAVAELVALSTLGGAPPAARVSELARPALWLRAVALAVSLGTWAMPYLMRQHFDWHTTSQIYLYVGYVETLLNLTGTGFLIELLLRLRRFAAPTDTQIAENESQVRAGLWAALVARIISGYASYALGYHFSRVEGIGQWAALAIRLPFTVLFYGLMLWLLQATATVLRSYQPEAASDKRAPLDGLADQVDSNAAYRNMMFGALWAVGGIGITFATYANAHSFGGRYTVAYGAIIAGVIQFIRGLTQLGGSSSKS